MDIASRTTEGLPSKCPVCGKKVCITPSIPLGDATCPHCGHLLWISDPPQIVGDNIQRLAELGAFVETDDQGEVRRIQFFGSHYDDRIVQRFAKLRGIPLIDVRHTSISPVGVKTLRNLLPGTIVEY